MTHIQTKSQGQRSIGSKDRMDGQTDIQTLPIVLPSRLTRSVTIIMILILLLLLLLWLLLLLLLLLSK